MENFSLDLMNFCMKLSELQNVKLTQMMFFFVKSFTEVFGQKGGQKSVFLSVYNKLVP